jgi:hypothetical protein
MNSAFRFSTRCASLFLLILLALAWTSTIFAEGESTIVRIEEDWTLNVTSPVQGIVAPQLMTVISPRGDTNSIYAVLTINHRDLPEFAGGGLQLQIWNNKSAEKYTNFSNDAMLNYMEAEETVTWTQTMKIEDGKLIFAILNGHSQTWGQFGGTEDLQASVPTSLTNLNGYSPAVSIKNSGISYAANRVRALTINKVRWITATGQVYEDSNTKVIYPPSQP